MIDLNQVFPLTWPFNYQVRAARVALRRFCGRGLLCDQVGMSKAIDAGLVLKEYL